MSNQMSLDEKYGVRFFVEVALNDDERATYLAKSLAGKAIKSDLCQEDASAQELVYTGLAFIKELGLDAEETSKKIAERLEFNGNGYQSGLLRNLDPKLGSVAQFAQSVRKVSAVLKNWTQINSDIPEPGITPEIGDVFAQQVESELKNQSLTQDVARLNKIFRTPFKEKTVVFLGADVRAVMAWSEEEETAVIHRDTLDLWVEDFGINTPVPDHVSNQFGQLAEYFLDNKESYNDCKQQQKEREQEYRNSMGAAF